jgi:hypothetical protein
MSYAVSLSNAGYEALTDYRNRWADEAGQVGKLGRLLVEPLYLGLVLAGAVETTARAVCALVLKGVFFVACHIPLPWQCVDNLLDDLQDCIDWIRDSALTCATATTASALSLKNNLTHSGSIDARAQCRSVEKIARRHFVSDVDNNHSAFAKPFSLAVLKALTEWRNNFTHQGEIVRTTKVFKQISTIPLYLGVAVLGALEALARAVCAVAAYALLLPLLPIVSSALGYRADDDANWIFYQSIGLGGSAVYSLGVTGAALISLKDTFMKNSDRVYEPGQMDHKRQIDFGFNMAWASVNFAKTVSLGTLLFVVAPPFAAFMGIVEMGRGVFTLNGAALAQGAFYFAVSPIGGFISIIRLIDDAGPALPDALGAVSASFLECFYPSTYY